jgi:hypothetical protein
VIRLLVALTLGLGVVLVSVPAMALPSEDPDDTWQTNGPVRDIIKVGETIFIGGQFTQLRENPVGQAGGQVIAVNNFAALDAATGSPLPVMLADPPDFTGTKAVVHAMNLAGGSLWVGGKFSAVDGARRFNVAALNPATLAVQNPDPRISGPVFAVTSDDARIYAGGNFLKVEGSPRARLVALSMSGVPDSDWTPSADDKVRDVALTADGNALFITGHFRNVAGSSGGLQPRGAIAKLTTASGNLQSWQPTGIKYNTLKDRGMGVNVVGERVYWAVAQSDWAGAFNVSTGYRYWKTDTDGTVNDVVEMGDRVIIGGHFVLVAFEPFYNKCAADPDSCDRHSKIAALNMNGVLDQSWNAGLQGSGKEWQGAKRFLVDGGKLWIGGAYLEISHEPQTFFGRLS